MVGCHHLTTVRRKEPCTWKGQRSDSRVTVDTVSTGLKNAHVKRAARGLEKKHTVWPVGKSEKENPVTNDSHTTR